LKGKTGLERVGMTDGGRGHGLPDQDGDQN
jgi:hypothetical protein